MLTLTRVYLIGHGSGGCRVRFGSSSSFRWPFRRLLRFHRSPVDFHSFRGLDLYNTANIYHDDAGVAHAAVRSPAFGEPTWQEVADSEEPLRVGWLASWEAIFSPRDKKGKPLPLFDRATGQVDPVVFKAWQKYDLDAEVATLPVDQLFQIRPRLHVYVGDTDVYQRDGSVRLMHTVGSDIDVHILPGDQDAIQTPALDAQISKAIRVLAYGAG